LWDTADAKSLTVDPDARHSTSTDLGISVTSLADEVTRALEEAETRDQRERERRRPARTRKASRTQSAAPDAAAAAPSARADAPLALEPALPALPASMPDEDPAVLEARRMEREAEAQRLLAEEQARARAREAAEIAARARAEREKSERRLEREHEQVQARAQALARERVDVEALRAPRRPRPAWVRYAAAAALLGAIIGLPEVIPYSAPIPEIERKLSAATGQPVAIGSLHFSLVPTPAFRLSGVTLGTGDQAVTIDRMRALPQLGSLFSGPVRVERLQIASATVPAGALDQLPALLAFPSGSGYAIASVEVDRLQLSLPGGLALPASGAQVNWTSAGAVERASLRATDGSVTLEVAASGGGFGVQFAATRWQARANSPLLFQSLQVAGRVSGGALEDGRFVAEVFGGSLKGTVRASRSAAEGYQASGAAQFSAVDASALATLLSPHASAAGAADVTVQFELSGKRVTDLPNAPRASASFVVRQGWVGGVDLVLMIRDPGARGGRTVFDEWSGTFSATATGQTLRQMKLVSGPLGASGSLDIAPDGRLTGRIASELQAASGTLRSTVGLAGTLREITASPAN